MGLYDISRLEVFMHYPNPVQVLHQLKYLISAGSPSMSRQLHEAFATYCSEDISRSHEYKTPGHKSRIKMSMLSPSNAP
jgi:hypothetical protein